MAYIKTIDIIDRQAGKVTESTASAHDLGFQSPVVGDPLELLRESVYRHVGSKMANMTFREAFVQTPDAGNMLRDAIRYLAFSRYAELPAGWEAFTMSETSARPQEEYLRDAAIGVIPKYKSGEPTQIVKSSFEGGVIIKNDQYRALVEIAMDEMRFDRIGKIRQIAQELGRAGRMTEAKAAFDVLTTTGNYNRAATTNDNDVGANTANTTFNAVGFEDARAIIATAKDRKSGAYLNFSADTLVVGPRLEMAAKQLLMSDSIEREGGNTTNEVRGTGTRNPYFNLVRRIIVSPWFSANYAWALMDSTVQPIVFQRVEPFNVMEETPGLTSEAYMTKDSLRWLVMSYFGVGMVDDRCCFLSSSSTAPTVS